MDPLKAKRKRVNASAVSLGLSILKVENRVLLMNSNGNELARICVDEAIDVSDVGIFNSFRRRIQYCERVLGLIGVRKGKGGAKQEVEEFVLKVTDRLRPKVEKLISSSGFDSHLLLFVAIRNISQEVSVVYEYSQGTMEKLCALHQEEIFVPLIGLRTTSGTLDHSTTRTKVYEAKALLTIMQEIASNGNFATECVACLIHSSDFNYCFRFIIGNSSLISAFGVCRLGEGI